MNSVMDFLYSWTKPLTSALWFKRLMSFIIFLNPLALTPQVWSALTAPSIEGISVHMFFAFAAIQTAFVFNGIETRNKSIFISMSISLLESCVIIVTVYIRGQ